MSASTIAMPLLFGVLAAATPVAAPMWLMAAMLLAARWPASRLGRAAPPSEPDAGRV